MMVLGLTAVSVLVNNNAGFHRAVTRRVRLCPNVHVHATRPAIRWRTEHGVVGAGAVLGVEDHEVIPFSTCTVVVGLEVAGLFVEAEGIEEVMVGVGGVEQLGD